MIPKYIYKVLDRYGNAYVSPELIAKFGGIEYLINELQANGYDCIAEIKSVNMRDFGSGTSIKSIDTIISVRRDK